MKKNYSHITFIIDRSGSMCTCWDDVIGGYNQFVTEQKKGEGDCTFSLVAFDDKYDKPLDFADIKVVSESISELNILPRGSTALYDAIGKAISETGEKLSKLNEENRPEKVMVVIQTDGYENASREYTSSTVKDLIKQQEEKYNWQFMFVGADKNACMGAVRDLGIKLNSVAHYNTVKTGNTFRILNDKLLAARSATNDEQYKAATTFTSQELNEIQ